MGSWQEFVITDQVKTKLVSVLAKKTDIFSFESEPLLASLIACLGLQFEIGKPQWDRLSQALTVNSRDNWQTQIITYEGQIGLRMWIEGVDEFIPRHEDFKDILHPLSLTNGKLSQIVIFPMLVANAFKHRGLNLVIVKDWVLSTFLTTNSVNYLKTNTYELEKNSALIQAQLMSSKCISFSGTHDLVDHLLGGNESGFDQNLLSRVQHIYQSVFSHQGSQKRLLVISYLIGVLLDDLAQPIWYNSSHHLSLLEKSLDLLCASVAVMDDDIKTLTVPDSFNDLVTELRGKNPTQLDLLFQIFAHQLGCLITKPSTYRIFQPQQRTHEIPAKITR